MTREVEKLAGVGERLVELKAQHEQLEREADEVFVLQSMLPELEAAAAQAGALRRKKEALQQEYDEVGDDGEEGYKVMGAQGEEAGTQRV